MSEFRLPQSQWSASARWVALAVGISLYLGLSSATENTRRLMAPALRGARGRPRAADRVAASTRGEAGAVGGGAVRKRDREARRCAGAEHLHSRCAGRDAAGRRCRDHRPWRAEPQMEAVVGRASGRGLVGPTRRHRVDRGGSVAGRLEVAGAVLDPHARHHDPASGYADPNRRQVRRPALAGGDHLAICRCTSRRWPPRPL